MLEGERRFNPSLSCCLLHLSLCFSVFWLCSLRCFLPNNDLALESRPPAADLIGVDSSFLQLHPRSRWRLIGNRCRLAIKAGRIKAGQTHCRWKRALSETRLLWYRVHVHWLFCVCRIIMWRINVFVFFGKSVLLKNTLVSWCLAAVFLYLLQS